MTSAVARRAIATKTFDDVIITHAQAQQTEIAFDYVTGARTQECGKAAINTVDTGCFRTLSNDQEFGMTGESTALAQNLTLTMAMSGEKQYPSYCYIDQKVRSLLDRWIQV